MGNNVAQPNIYTKAHTERMTTQMNGWLSF